MATAPRRATKVPGATTPAETTTAQNAEDALEAILGTAETPNADAKDQTQTEADADPTPAETTTPPNTASEVDNVDEAELAEYEEFKKWRAMKGAVASVQKAPVAVAVVSEAPSEGGYRDVLTEAGWVREKA